MTPAATVPLAPPSTFDAFIERHRISLSVHERSRRSGLSRWYTQERPSIEIREDGLLKSVSGNGDTPDAAIADLARQLVGHRLLIDHQFEVVTPNQWTPAGQRHTGVTAADHEPVVTVICGAALVRATREADGWRCEGCGKPVRVVS